ncbi:hypothetical protein ACTL32_11105 [Planococcus sp. FY231025]|uniref:hypothetical protein n=1 Tax=Planococcus sp. FY231025 TaxID=3455699 RepID=UPI003F92A1C1
MAKAHEGSQFHLQEYINHHRQEIDNAIFTSSPSLLIFADPARKLQWIYTLANDKGTEYDDGFLEHLVQDPQQLIEARKLIKQYWPVRGPVWDGLALVKGKKNELGIILVEAKAHPAEIISESADSSEMREEQLRELLKMAQDAFGSASELDPWIHKYKQLASRLSFLALLSRELNIPAWLVLVNFINDKEHKETSVTEWKNHYAEVFDTLDFKADAPLVNRIALPIMLSVTTTRKLLRDTDRMVGLE